MTDWVKLARAELASEQAHGKARQRYHRDWWNLSLSLAEATERAEVSAALDAIEPILGSDRPSVRSYLNKRRKMALTVQREVVESGLIYDLPPTHCMTWFDEKQGVIDKAAAETIREFAIQGIGKRGMVTALGGTNRPALMTQDERQRVQPTPEQISNAIQQDPNVRRTVVEHVARDRKLAHEVMSDRDAARQVEHARQDVVRDRLAKANLRPGRREPELDTPVEIATVLRELTAARVSVRRCLRILADVPMTDDVRNTVDVALTRLEGATSAMRQVIDGDAEIDAALAQIMEGAE